MEMSATSSFEDTSQVTLRSWPIAAAGTGLMIAGLIIGMYLPWGREQVVRAPSQETAAVEENAPALTPDADYGIRHSQGNELPALDRRADYGIRHLRQGAPALDTKADGIRAAAEGTSVLDNTTDYGIRHPEQSAPPLDSSADYGIRHPGVRGRSYVKDTR